MSARHSQAHASDPSDRASGSASRESSAAIERYLEDDDPWRKSVAACKDKEPKNKEPLNRASSDTQKSLADMEKHMEEHQEKHSLGNTWR